MLAATFAQIFGLLLCASPSSLSNSNSRSNLAPPAIPSGMDLLYGDRVAVSSSGEPAVALGLMTGQRVIHVQASGSVTLDFYERSVHKRTHLAGQHRVSVKVAESTAAQTSYFVQLASVPQRRRHKLAGTLKLWQDRGFSNAQAIEHGTVLGVGGNVIDTRHVRIITLASSAARANKIVDRVYRQFEIRASVQERIHKHPWARLQVTVDGKPLGEATSYVRLSPAVGTSPLLVEKVEYAKGYRWHGFEHRKYHGDIYLVVDRQGHLAAVNVVGAESILAGVVPSELFATAHSESLKAQAVAARNILFSQLGRRHHADPFQLCSAQHCQVYGGVTKEQNSTTQAVKATTGVVLFKNGHLIDATYSSTCGGHTEHNHLVWGNVASPALKAASDLIHPTGKYAKGITPENIRTWLTNPPATYCNTSSKARASTFRWSRRFGFKELFKTLHDKAPSIGRLKDVRIQGRGPGGRVTGLELVGTESTHTIHYELPIRRFFNNLKSGTFVVDLERNPQGLIEALTFTGAGWGHGVGMCQMGAIGRAEAGHNFKKILRHYYNKAQVSQLYSESMLASP